jgi:hypothetical protein
MSDTSGGIPPVEPLPVVPQPEVRPDPYAQSDPLAQQTPLPPAPAGYAPAGYGYPAAPAPLPQYAPVPHRRSSVLSILSLVFGIVSIVGSIVYFIPFVGAFLGLWFPAASVVLGFIARKKENHAKGMWITGIILGFVALALAILSVVIWVLVLVNNGFSDSNSGFDDSFGSGIDS